MIALYNAANGPGWKNSENWLSDAPLDQWHGVVADCDGSVIGLNLGDNQLTGRSRRSWATSPAWDSWTSLRTN